MAPLTSRTVVAPIVDAVIASLNVTVTTLDRRTPVAPLAGVVPVTTGGVESDAVVNDQTTSAASALFAASLMPLAPPFTVAV